MQITYKIKGIELQLNYCIFASLCFEILFCHSQGLLKRFENFWLKGANVVTKGLICKICDKVKGLFKSF